MSIETKKLRIIFGEKTIFDGYAADLQLVIKREVYHKTSEKMSGMEKTISSNIGEIELNAKSVIFAK